MLLRLLNFFVLKVQCLFKEGVYSRRVFIRGGHLFEEGIYSRKAFI